jgi:hypothetical protein
MLCKTNGTPSKEWGERKGETNCTNQTLGHQKHPTESSMSRSPSECKLINISYDMLIVFKKTTVYMILSSYTTQNLTPSSAVPPPCDELIL